MWTSATGSSTVGVALNVAFALGVLANLVKAADLMVRPHQQKRIQQGLEDFTLRLEYLDTTKLLNTLSNPHEIGRLTRSILYIQSVGIGLQFIVVFFASIAGEFPLSTILYALGSAVGMVVLLRSGWVEISMRWFVGSASLLPFCIRYAFLLALEVLPLMILQKNLMLSKNLFRVQNSQEINLLLLVFPLLAVYSIALYIGACWIVAELGRLMLINCVKALRGIAWRIVEFNKGAVAAVVLIVTVFLGIATQITK